MAGFSSVTGQQAIMFADNASFDGTERGGALTTDGQLWIGSTASPHVKVGNITAGTGISVTNSSGGISIASTSTGGGFGPGITSGTTLSSTVNDLVAVTVPYGYSADESAFGTGNILSSSMFLVPIYVDETSHTFTNLGIHVTNTPGAGAQVQLAIYDRTGTGGFPGSVLASVSALSVAAGGSNFFGTISLSLTTGWYWAAVQSNGTGTVTATCYTPSGNGGIISNKAYISGNNAANAPLSSNGFQSTNSFGTFPSNPTITNIYQQNSVPLIMMY